MHKSHFSRGRELQDKYYKKAVESVYLIFQEINRQNNELDYDMDDLLAS